MMHMNVIIKRKRHGKTTELIEEFKKDPNGRFIARNENEINRLKKEYNLQGYRFNTWYDIDHQNIIYKRNLYFDNLDQYIAHKTGNILKSFSMTYNKDMGEEKKCMIPSEMWKIWKLKN